jgi:hypothetical protein
MGGATETWGDNNSQQLVDPSQMAQYGQDVGNGINNLFSLLKQGYQSLSNNTEGVANASPVPQQPAQQPQMTEADAIVQKSAQDSLKSKADDIHDSMPMQNLAQLVNGWGQASGTPTPAQTGNASINAVSAQTLSGLMPQSQATGQQTPAVTPTPTGNPNGATTTPSNSMNPNPDTLFGQLFNINPNKANGTPESLGIVPNILQFLAKGQFANSNETNAAAAEMRQEIQGTKKIQPYEQKGLDIRQQEVGVAQVAVKKEALSKSLEMINEHKSKLLEQFNAEKGTKSFWGSLGANLTGQGQQLTPKQIGIQAELSKGKEYEDDLKSQLAALGGSANPELDSLLQEKARRSKQ